MRRGYLGEFEQIVLLAVCRLEDDAYGMRIRQEIESRVERSVSIGALYVTLERLARKGFLRARTGDPTPQRGGRAKRFYDITPAGITALEHSRDDLARMWRGLRVSRRVP